MSYRSQFTGPEIDELLSRMNTESLRPYRTFTCLLSQALEQQPTSIILEDQLGDVMIQRPGLGYIFFNSNYFEFAKTVVPVSGNGANPAFNSMTPYVDDEGVEGYMQWWIQPGTYWEIHLKSFTTNKTTRKDLHLSRFFVEFRIYP